MWDNLIILSGTHRIRTYSHRKEERLENIARVLQVRICAYIGLIVLKNYFNSQCTCRCTHSIDLHVIEIIFISERSEIDL